MVSFFAGSMNTLNTKIAWNLYSIVFRMLALMRYIYFLTDSCWSNIECMNAYCFVLLTLEHDLFLFSLLRLRLWAPWKLFLTWKRCEVSSFRHGLYIDYFKIVSSITPITSPNNLHRLVIYEKSSPGPNKALLVFSIRNFAMQCDLCMLGGAI